jgi:hypothetical protein
VRQAGATPFEIPGGAIVPALAAAAILFLLSSVTAKEWTVLVVVVVVASGLYAGSAMRRVSVHDSPRPS